MHDFKDWLLGVVGAAMLAAFGWLFSVQVRRKTSAGKVADAVDAASIDYVQQILTDLDQLQQKYDALLERYMKTRDGLAELRADKSILEDHVRRLTRVVVHEHPKEATFIEESGFMDMDGVL